MMLCTAAREESYGKAIVDVSYDTRVWTTELCMRRMHQLAGKRRGINANWPSELSR